MMINARIDDYQHIELINLIYIKEIGSNFLGNTYIVLN
jgi:hypothetical protein